MQKAIFLIAIAGVLLSSCSSNSNNKTLSVSAFKQTPLDSAYTALRPAVQVFTIDNSKANKLKAGNGTEILIPANCFVTADGSKAENVQLEIVEAFSLPEFITSGMVTLSDGKLLISNGMLYINARSGNENLQLENGSSLTVSMPTMGNNNGFQLFTGNGSNWTLDTTMTETDYATPVPLDLLYPEGNSIFWYCITNVGDKDEKTYLHDTTILNVTKREYENTVIATEEFGKRFGVLMGMMQWMSLFVNRDYYFDKTECENQKSNYDIWKAYLDNPRRSLFESDSVAKKMYVDYFRNNKEKLAAFCDEVNAHKRNHYYNWTDTNYYYDFRKVSLEEQFMEPLKNFPVATKEIKIINDHGVNLDAPDAFEQLSAKQIDISEINQIMEYHFRRQAMIRQLQQIKEAIVSKNKLEKMYESTVFSVSQLGWINCDRFYDDPSAGKAAIWVSNSSANKLDFIDCSLVIPEMNARLSAFPDSTGKWTFTKKEGPYTQLPIGQDAVITGVSLRNDSVFFASQKIKIADNLSVNLPMKYINKNSLRDSLAVALKN